MVDSKSRLVNYDVLRSLSCISIIMLHISSVYYGDTSSIPNVSTYSYYLSYFLNGIVRFAVPVFVMLSGAFNLSNLQNKNIRYFYKKIIIKIIVPTVAFGLLYSAFSFLMGRSIITVLCNFLKGNPYYHMWYMFMIIGLFLITPFLIVLLEKYQISANHIFWTSLIITIGGYGSDHLFNWDLSYSISYLGYYLLGYTIFNSTKQKDNFEGFIYVVAGFFVELISLAIGFIVYHKGYFTMLNSNYLAPQSPVTYLASYLIFTGFARFSFRGFMLFKYISKYSLYIYICGMR